MNDQAPRTQEIDNTCSKCNAEGKGTYLTEGKCWNCGLEVPIRHSLGHEKGGDYSGRQRCPRCECREVRPGDFLAKQKPEEER